MFKVINYANSFASTSYTYALGQVNSFFFDSFFYYPVSVLNSFFNMSAGVSRLRFRGYPSTIFRKIPFVVINTIYRKIMRTFSHIIQKIKKIFAPTFAHYNTPPSISRKSWTSRIMASLYHGSPCRIGGGSIMTVFSKSRGRYLNFKTAATLGIAFSKIISIVITDFATFTNACPISAAFFGVAKRRLTKHFQSTKFFVNKVYNFTHKTMLTPEQFYGNFRRS